MISVWSTQLILTSTFMLPTINCTMQIEPNGYNNIVENRKVPF